MHVVKNNPPPFNTTKAIVLLLVLLALIAIGLTSCGSTNKIKSVQKSSIDSVTSFKKDSTVKKESDSTHLKKSASLTTTESTNDYEKETVILFDTAYAENMQMQGDGDTILWSTPNVTITDAADYFPLKFSPGPQRIKSITIKEKGKLKVIETKAENKTDSLAGKGKEDTHVADQGKTDVHKTESSKNKTVHRVSYTGYIIGFSLLLLLLLIYRYRRKIASLFIHV